MKHLASLQPPAWLPPVETPSDRSLSERHSWKPPWCFTLISCQVSNSVRECHSDYSSFCIYTKQRGRLVSPSVAAGARAWPCSSATSRRGGSQVAHVISGAISCRWDPFPQSALTYEATTLSHPVSHVLRFHTCWWRRRKKRKVGANHSWEINERRWGVMRDSLIIPAHTIVYV